MSKALETTNELLPLEKRMVNYIPFGAKSEIKLSVGIVKNLVCVRTKTGAVCDDQQAMRFIMMCQARQLNPFEGDAFLIGYDSKDGPTFSLITAHQAFLKRAEVNPEYDGMDSGLIVKDQDGATVDREGDFFFEGDSILGAWATVYFKHRNHPMKKRIRMATFNKGFGRWRDDPAGMLVKCVEADALRSSFPTLLGSLYLEEEVRPMIDITPHGETNGHAEAKAAPQTKAAAKEKLKPKAEPKQEPAPPAEPTQETMTEEPRTEAQKLRILSLIQEQKISPDRVTVMLADYNAKHVDKLSQTCGRAMIQRLEAMGRRQPGDEQE